VGGNGISVLSISREWLPTTYQAPALVATPLAATGQIAFRCQLAVFFVRFFNSAVSCSFLQPCALSRSAAFYLNFLGSAAAAIGLDFQNFGL